MAEIPTFQEIQESNIVPEPDHASVSGYLLKKAEIFKRNLWLEVNGRRLPLVAEPKAIIFPPGAGGLPTLKLAILYHATLEPNGSTGIYGLNFKDHNYPDRAGWKEVIIKTGSGVSLVSSSVPERDRSGQLSDYPTDLLNSPPQSLEARASFGVAGASMVASTGKAPAAEGKRGSVLSNARMPEQSEVPPKLVPSPSPATTNLTSANAGSRLQANLQGTPRNAFTELIADRRFGAGILLLALAVAAGLGALHALEPGHGKTLVAAYLVGTRGTVKHALLLGLIVTAAHTAGVYVLGAMTLFASQYIVPDRLYPWLGVVSGAMIAALGLTLLFRHFAGKHPLQSLPQRRSHQDHDDSHGGHVHHHGHPHRHHVHGQPASMREPIALGISGGIVPCPAALVVLLSAVAMGRIAFGFLLIVAFSAGLAGVLVGIGLLMVCARRFISRFDGVGQLTTRWLPMVSAGFVFLFGAALTFQSLHTVGFLRVSL
jgi:ABC-type nickel/cobalt efflux system permease component RcnA